MKRSYQPRVSFIIPTLNAEHILEKCLLAIRNQNYPQNKVEIIISDGGSTDSTKKISRKYDAKIIINPYILHEPGKSLASSKASGEIFFYTDADNILSHENWINCMIKPWQDNRSVMGFLPQTIPAPDSNWLDRYLGYLFTDPFTWFVYGASANPRDYSSIYSSLQQTDSYTLFKFPKNNFPLFGLSQGVGVSKLFKREEHAFADDILAGMKLIQKGGIVAYVPQAGIYHYHVQGLSNFISKYKWRIRNNMTQQVKGMGIRNRTNLFDQGKKIRMILFIPYSFTFIFSIIDGIKLSIKNRSILMMVHPLICLIISVLILSESSKTLLIRPTTPGVYK